MSQNPQPTAAVADSGEAPASAEQPGDSPSPEPSQPPARTPFFSRLFGFVKPRNGSTLREDLTDALSETVSTDDFSPGERAMLNNILRLREVRVEDVMIPRADVKAVDITTSLGDLLKMFEESGHSRMPAYSETLDDPRGMVHIRDVVTHITRLARQKKGHGARKPNPADPLDFGNIDLTRSIADLGLVRPLLFVPPSMLASDLMARMQAAHIQMALVIDEYGGTDGLASLEDIVEMVVGDIEDEHDDDEPMIVKSGEGVYIVDGRAEIEDVAETIGDSFEVGEHEDVDTIGGMIFNTLGRVPARGEVVQPVPGFEFHVLDADPRRVKRVRIVAGKAADRCRRQPREPAQTEA